MSKLIRHGKEARDAVLRGVDFLADAVKITEGPRGRNIILGQRSIGQSPKCTRDGVTVSNYANPSDTTELLAADLVSEAAEKTDNAVGDGTTAAIVLAQAMIHAGFKLIDAGANPMAIERGIHKATDAVIARLQQIEIPVEIGRDDQSSGTTDIFKYTQQHRNNKLFQIATVSAHGDQEIGRLVAGAVVTAGKGGVLTAEPSSTSDTYVETVAGLELEKANLIHGSFITHPESMTAEWQDCRILLWEGVIETARSLVPILSQVK